MTGQVMVNAAYGKESGRTNTLTTKNFSILDSPKRSWSGMSLGIGSLKLEFLENIVKFQT